MPSFEQVRDVAGVYLLTDLDGHVLYAGRSRTVRTRLLQHFVRQDSSATADGLLDLYAELHLLRAVRKTTLSGAAPAVRAALHQHASELTELLERHALE